MQIFIWCRSSLMAGYHGILTLLVEESYCNDSWSAPRIFPVGQVSVSLTFVGNEEKNCSDRIARAILFFIPNYISESAANLLRSVFMSSYCQDLIVTSDYPLNLEQKSLKSSR
jgi:hypothetical protein